MSHAEQIIQDLCDRTMWVTPEHVKKFTALCRERNIPDDEVVPLIEKAAPDIKKSWCKVFDRKGNQKDYYRFTPKIFRAGEEATVSVLCKYAHQKLCGQFRVYITEFFHFDFCPGTSRYASVTDVTAENNTISFLFRFPKEDAYTVTVYYLLDGEEHLLLSQMVYAVEDDLAALVPLKADLHIHSTESDGYDPPEMVAIAARKHGMDVIAVTDHNAYSGSVKAERFVGDSGLGMTVIRGEEYALEYSPMHILALGTDRPIDRKFLRKEIIDCRDGDYRLFENDSVTMNQDAYIATQMLLAEVKRMGGVSILAHPFWKPIDPKGFRMDTPEMFFKDLADRRLFDGIEIVSGSRDGECHTANLQNALATSLLGSFEHIPVTGITDSHCYTADPICGKHFTVLFAKANDKDGVLAALREGLCVAVETVGGDPLCYGQYRFVKFAQFLVAEYFPERDREAFIEASLAEKALLI